MRTFSIDTLGCKVNQYESEQIAALLRARGLVESESAGDADLRIVNTCSVTVQAASKCRQTVRRMTRLPVLNNVDSRTIRQPLHHDGESSRRARVLVTGCWATSDKAEASRLAGVDGVLGHHDDVAKQLDQFLTVWLADDAKNDRRTSAYLAVNPIAPNDPPPELVGDDGRIKTVDDPAGELIADSGTNRARKVNPNPEKPGRLRTRTVGTTSLPLLGERQAGHQRAFLKIQDGCDAHCTYCIIPRLRPSLWSKPIDDAVEEATRLVVAGHVEIVLTGIFLGAYGQPTALRRRQPSATRTPISQLIEALCTRVAGLRRLRLSSLEPGDLTPDLLAVLKSHSQVVPHFHLPLQSGSDVLLHRMNRQYTRDDFLHMVDNVNETFDRPALTTDIIVGFPGESEIEFARTLDVVDRARFIHTHAFSFSPRPQTAAARWTSDFVRGPVVNERIELLRERAEVHSYIFRKQFIDEMVELMVEQSSTEDDDLLIQHGRCARYFDVHFESNRSVVGQLVSVRIDRVTPHRTLGTLCAG